MKKNFFLSLFALLVCASSYAGSGKLIEFDIKERRAILKSLGITDEYDPNIVTGKPGVAIIDDNFGDRKRDADAYPTCIQDCQFRVVNTYENEFLQRNGLPTNKYLYPPLNTNLPDSKGRDTVEFRRNLPHGLFVLHSMLAVLGRHSQLFMYLLNGNRAYNFLAAAYYAERLFKENMIRTVVSSMVFRGAGATSGQPGEAAALNSVISTILRRNPGLTWFNASGNDGGRVWAGEAKRFKNSDYVQFRQDGEDADCLRFENHAAASSIGVELVWNGGNKISDGVSTNYDLEITDPSGTRLGKIEKDLEDFSSETVYQGTKLQRTGTEMGLVLDQDIPVEEKINETMEPIERILLSDLPRTEEGTYYCIRVRSKSEFTSEADNLQVVIISDKEAPMAQQGENQDPLNFIDANRVNEMFQPANARGVISVGTTAKFSSRAYSPNGDLLPVIFATPNQISLNNGNFQVGTSFTAPMLAAAKILAERYGGQVTPEEIIAFRKATNPTFVPLDKLKMKIENGETLIEKLLELTGSENEQRFLRGYLDNEGIAVVTFPYGPSTYLKRVPKAAIQNPNAFDFYFGIRKDVASGEPMLFKHLRLKNSRQAYPWEEERLPYVTYTSNERKFTKADFVRAEEEMGQFRLFEMPTKEKLINRKAKR